MRVYKLLLRMAPHLEDRLMDSSEEEVMAIANMVSSIQVRETHSGLTLYI